LISGGGDNADFHDPTRTCKHTDRDVSNMRENDFLFLLDEITPTSADAPAKQCTKLGVVPEPIEKIIVDFSKRQLPLLQRHHTGRMH